MFRNDTNEPIKWQSNAASSFTSSYNTVNYFNYGTRTEQIQEPVVQHTENTSDTWKTTVNTSSINEGSVAQASSTSDNTIYTKNTAETERYLDSQGITLCKGSDVIRKTVLGDPTDYEQRVCLRYLQPPPLPKPGVIKYMSANLFSPNIYNFSHLLLKKYENQRWWNPN